MQGISLWLHQRKIEEKRRESKKFHFFPTRSFCFPLEFFFAFIFFKGINAHINLLPLHTLPDPSNIFIFLICIYQIDLFLNAQLLTFNFIIPNTPYHPFHISTSVSVSMRDSLTRKVLIKIINNNNKNKTSNRTIFARLKNYYQHKAD